jgi:hypothetical protein
LTTATSSRTVQSVLNVPLHYLDEVTGYLGEHLLALKLNGGLVGRHP